MDMDGHGWGRGENLIAALNPSPNLSTKFIPFLTWIPSQIIIKWVQMYWGRIGRLSHIAIPTSESRTLCLIQEKNSLNLMFLWSESLTGLVPFSCWRGRVFGRALAFTDRSWARVVLYGWWWWWRDDVGAVWFNFFSILISQISHCRTSWPETNGQLEVWLVVAMVLFVVGRLCCRFMGKFWWLFTSLMDGDVWVCLFWVFNSFPLQSVFSISKRWQWFEFFGC